MNFLRRTISVYLMLLLFLGQSVTASVIACEMSNVPMSEMDITSQDTGSQHHAHHQMSGLEVAQEESNANHNMMAMSDCCDESGTCFMSGCITASINILHLIQPPLALPMSKLSTANQPTQKQMLSLFRPPISI